MIHRTAPVEFPKPEDQTHVRIERILFERDRKIALVTFANGVLDGGTFREINREQVGFTGQKFMDLVKVKANANEMLKDFLVRVFEEKIAAGEIPGTVEPDA